MGQYIIERENLKDMGNFQEKNIDDLEAGHRDEAHKLKVSGEDEKEDPLDFVLWKPKKRENLHGIPIGVMEDRAGILNVL